MEDTMQYTVLIPGGFKPPHKGHYEYIKFYLDNPDVKEVRLYIGQKERDEICIETTEAILDLYGLLEHPKLVYRRAIIREGKNGPYTNPLLDCYEYADTIIEEPVALGCSEKDKDYGQRFCKYFDGIRANVFNAPLCPVPVYPSATNFREALRNGDSIAQFLPDGVSEEQIMKLFKT